MGAPEEPVPLADAEIAAGIARAARKGRGADRAPTLEQLLAAFGEQEPTSRARRRVRSALDVAAIRTRPDLADAPPGERVLLQVDGAASGGHGGGRVLGGLLAVAAILVAAAVAATLLGRNDHSADQDLPPDRPATTGIAAAPAGARTTTTGRTAGRTTTIPTTTAPAAGTRTTTTPARTTPAETTTTAGAAPAPARRSVTVRVTAAARPTFLCVEDGRGTQLFGGTLSGSKTFRATRVRLNIGLASTRVTVDGRDVPLSGSPTGLEITRRGGVRTLPLGQRPCG